MCTSQNILGVWCERNTSGGCDLCDTILSCNEKTGPCCATRGSDVWPSTGFMDLIRSKAPFPPSWSLSRFVLIWSGIRRNQYICRIISVNCSKPKTKVCCGSVQSHNWPQNYSDAGSCCLAVALWSAAVRFCCKVQTEHTIILYYQDIYATLEEGPVRPRSLWQNSHFGVSHWCWGHHFRNPAWGSALGH